VTLDAAQALGLIPQGLRSELLAEFAKITRNYREGRWEAAELDGGRLCEVAYTILDAHTSGSPYPATASKPSNFKRSCEALESRIGSESARLTIPRLLVALYDVRNRRGVGHVGGDVGANHMDSELVLAMSKWIVAELVRLFHNIDVKTATDVVNALVDRSLPVIWEVEGVKRVLNTGLSLTAQTLTLLYSEPGAISDNDLAKHLEQDRLANYRRVLDRLHRARAIEWNKATGMATLSPRGREDVEARILK
jgi:hypothetical protein